MTASASRRPWRATASMRPAPVSMMKTAEWRSSPPRWASREALEASRPCSSPEQSPQRLGRRGPGPPRAPSRAAPPTAPPPAPPRRAPVLEGVEEVGGRPRRLQERDLLPKAGLPGFLGGLRRTLEAQGRRHHQGLEVGNGLPPEHDGVLELAAHRFQVLPGARGKDAERPLDWARGGRRPPQLGHLEDVLRGAPHLRPDRPPRPRLGQGKPLEAGAPPR